MENKYIAFWHFFRELEEKLKIAITMAATGFDIE
jgi:hypothetical protein